MKRVLFIIVLCVSSLIAFPQDCEELMAEYEQQDANYKSLTTAQKAEKEKSITQMELILNRAEEANCGFKKQWARDLRQRKQALYPSDAVFEQTSYVFSASADIIKIGVKQKNIKLISYPDWLIPMATEDNKHFDFALTENKIPYRRMGVIEVDDGKKRHKCTITQGAAKLFVNVTEHLGFGQDGGTCSVFVETNDTSWTVSGSNNWVTAKWTDYGAQVVCAKNLTKTKRTTVLKVKLGCGETRKVEIGQVLGRTTLSVPQKTFAFGNDGGLNNSVAVKCNYDQWTASSNAKWLTVKKKYGGICIECSPNTLASERKATIKIETNDNDNLVEYISVSQKEATAYISTAQNTYRSDGLERTLYVNVNTNILDWSASLDKGGHWTTINRVGDQVRVHLKRDDCNCARTSEITVSGKGKSSTFYVTQPNRGYSGRYNDYFDEIGGDWRVTWFSAETNIMTAVGLNISTINVRWKPVELALLNFNMNYNILAGNFNIGWEPLVRGYLPVSRDGRWAAYAGIGAHVDFIDSSHFLAELGMECQWTEKYSSRIFFKYNGGCALGMSFDIGTWY